MSAPVLKLPLPLYLHRAGKRIWLNPLNVERVEDGDAGVHIHFASGAFIRVDESIETVVAMLAEWLERI